MPRLISIEEDENGYDRVGLRLRLAAEVPSAVLDDHTRWREPLKRLIVFGFWVGYQLDWYFSL